LLTRENKKLDIMEKIVLVAGILVLTAFTFIPQKKEKKEVSNTRPNSIVIAPQKISSAALPSSAMWAKAAKVNKKKIKKPVVVPTVTIDSPPPRATINYDDLQFPGISNNINDDGKTRKQTTVATDQNGKKYTITKLNGKVTSLTIDGNNIPEKEFDNYNSLVQRVDARTHGDKVRSQKEMEERRAQTEQKQKEREKRLEESKKERERDLKDSEKKRSEKSERMEEARREKIDEDRKERDNERKEKERERRKESEKRSKEDKERNRKEENERDTKRKEIDKERKEKREIQEKREKKDIKIDKNSRTDIEEKHELNKEFHLESKLEFKPNSTVKLDQKSELHLRGEYTLAKNSEPMVPTAKAEPTVPKPPLFKAKPRWEPAPSKRKLFSQPSTKLFSQKV
jgi:hypothetical protein